MNNTPFLNTSKNYKLNQFIQPDKYDVFIDESCYLPDDQHHCIACGGLFVPKELVRPISKELKLIFKKYKFIKEFKWNNISQSRLQLYKDALEISLFSNERIWFRSVITEDKSLINFNYNNSNSDEYWYKMVYYLLNNTNNDNKQFRIFLDYRNTWGKNRIEQLKKYLNPDKFVYFQSLHSHDSILIQISDIILGALTYNLRKNLFFNNYSFNYVVKNKIKDDFIDYLKNRTNVDFLKQTSLFEKKFNIFYLTPGARYGK